ncbi:hypothetical protein GCM10022409_29910 [Hymenobacter glaciei]|uniref:Uncharacterized protein n=1 Tax=Hymenobacter glaciei TaxID=877209 RepID=A0ABP7UF78_9BACT
MPPRHPGTAGFDGAGYFQPGHQATYITAPRILPLPHQHIRPVYTSGMHPNQDLMRRRLRLSNLPKLQHFLSTRLLDYDSIHWKVKKETDLCNAIKYSFESKRVKERHTERSEASRVQR